MGSNSGFLLGSRGIFRSRGSRRVFDSRSSRSGTAVAGRSRSTAGRLRSAARRGGLAAGRSRRTAGRGRSMAVMLHRGAAGVLHGSAAAVLGFAAAVIFLEAAEQTGVGTVDATDEECDSGDRHRAQNFTTHVCLLIACGTTRPTGGPTAGNTPTLNSRQDKRVDIAWSLGSSWDSGLTINFTKCEVKRK